MSHTTLQAVIRQQRIVIEYADDIAVCVRDARKQLYHLGVLARAGTCHELHVCWAFRVRLPCTMARKQFLANALPLGIVVVNEVQKL